MSDEEMPQYQQPLVTSWFNGGNEPDPEAEEGPSANEAQPSPDNPGEDFSSDGGVDMGEEEVELLPPVTYEQNLRAETQEEEN